MKKQKYITMGTPVLSKEIFRKVLRPFNNDSYKPNGGLWSCEYIEPEISQWYSYLQEKNSLVWFMDFIHACEFTLKDNSRILQIKTYEELQELIKKYPSYHHILNGYNNKYECFDFELLSHNYDGIIVKPYAHNLYSKTDIFRKWSVDTLLLFNIDCIESYKSVYVDWDPELKEDYPKIKDKSNPKQVEERTKTYITLYELAESLFIELLSQIKDMSFNDYDEYFEKLVEISNKVMKIIIDSNNIELLELTEKYTNLNLRIEKLHIIRNIVLNILSDFLEKDKKRIINLPKSNHTKRKIYKL